MDFSKLDFSTSSSHNSTNTGPIDMFFTKKYNYFSQETRWNHPFLSQTPLKRCFGSLKLTSGFIWPSSLDYLLWYSWLWHPLEMMVSCWKEKWRKQVRMVQEETNKLLIDEPYYLHLNFLDCYKVKEGILEGILLCKGVQMWSPKLN